MNLDLYKMPFYYQTTWNNLTRQEHIEKEFSDISLKKVMASAPTIHTKELPLHAKIISGTIAQMRIVDFGLRNQERNKAFQPFALLEDDVSKYKTFPNTITIPDDTDILYIGISMASSIEQPPYYVFKNFGYETENNSIIRIHHMLSTHGMVFCSLRACTIHTNALSESIHQKLNYDVILARIQSSFNIYALKEPLVYQDKNVGGLQQSTQLSIRKVFDPKNIPTVETVTKHCKSTI